MHQGSKITMRICCRINKIYKIKKLCLNQKVLEVREVYSKIKPKFKYKNHSKIK